jgi:hypothetical protein
MAVMSFLSKVFLLYIERWHWFMELLTEWLKISLISVILDVAPQRDRLCDPG